MDTANSMADNNSKASQKKKTKRRKLCWGNTLELITFDFRQEHYITTNLLKTELVGNCLYSSANLQDDGENGIKETFEFTT